MKRILLLSSWLLISSLASADLLNDGQSLECKYVNIESGVQFQGSTTIFRRGSQFVYQMDGLSGPNVSSDPQQIKLELSFFQLMGAYYNEDITIQKNGDSISGTIEKLDVDPDQGSSRSSTVLTNCRVN